MKKEKEVHFIQQREPIIIDGHVVGESWAGEWVDGPPAFGLCHAVDCPNVATTENLIGCHFCDQHNRRFYDSEDHFQIDPSREFSQQSKEEH